MTKAGGSHWSLLVWRQGQFYHFDSASSNESAARDTANALSGTLNVPVPIEVKVKLLITFERLIFSLNF